MRVSLIATVLNEASSLPYLLDSILSQVYQPDEVIIADGGSQDGTLKVLEDYQSRLPLKVIDAPGCNISRGRNLAIAAATGNIIAATDTGVHLSPDWLSNIISPFNSTSPPSVVSGFFSADPHTTFELALGVTTLPELEDVEPDHFMPSSRSVAFTKQAWEAVGGYPEWLDYCEDLVFDFALRRANYDFVFVPDAVVHFRPRSHLASFFSQYFRYARGDGKAGLWAKRHLIRYSSYAFAVVSVLLGRRYPVLPALTLAGAALHLYAPYKRLIPRLREALPREAAMAAAYVPLVRVTGDVAKMLGYPVGLWWRWIQKGSDV
jgi:glycosyltransferase involved in cell wall biosynthesis